MLIIGLTGGIGCGKTTITNLFSELNVPVSDADLIAHQLVEPGQPALAEITQLFGPEVISKEGRLDRTTLRKLIFKEAKAKEQLENILHPLIFTEMNRWATQQESPYVIFSIPLLIETHQQKLVDRVLVIDLSEAQQISRVIERDHLSKEAVLKIISAQVPRFKRREVADDLILNSHSKEQLKKQVSILHQFYLKLSQECR
jgi:dephospho-CoA kinase